MANHIGMPLLNLAQTGIQNLAHPRGVGRQIFRHDFFQVSQRSGAADWIARVSAGHGPWRELIHYFRASDHRRQRQRTADAFAATNHIRGDSIMLETPELAGASKTSLHLVENE